MSDSTSKTLLWFRHQLRIDDQPLFDAIQPGSDDVVGLWILDPRSHFDDRHGFTRTGPHRLRFLLETVDELRASMRALNTDLLIRVGRPEDIIPGLVDQLDIEQVCLVEEPGTEEHAVERATIDRISCRCTRLVPETLLQIDDPQEFARSLPEVFSSFRRNAEKHLEPRPPRNAPPGLRGMTLPADFDHGALPHLPLEGIPEQPVDERTVLRFHGGESSGRDRLQQWMHDGDNLKQYKQTRNGMLGPDYSSKFSPWISTGALSSRRINEETFRYERENIANESTYWLRFELLWREYFRLYLLKHGPRMFQSAGPSGVRLDWGRDQFRFEAWKNGVTGVPLVDANMRELQATGFMSNRGRQIVASFLAKNLDVDWRWGARWFEHCLIDYCPAANWGNWTYAAGVGADPRGFRGFDIARQARNYDSDGAYVAHWLPEELHGLKGMARHEPWKHGRPAPIVDPTRSLKAAQDRWESAHQRHPS